MLGFTYNGKHSDDMRLKRNPKDTELGDFMSDFEVLSDNRSWAAGSDYYASRTKARTFSLGCYYEMLTRRELEDILRWLDRQTSGTLVFDERPHARYFVRPSKAVAAKNYFQYVGNARYYSGTMTVTFTAYYPYAELLETVRDKAGVAAIRV